MSDDTEKLQQAVYALRESIDIIERATIVVGAVDPDGLESLLQEAFTRFLYRAGRYDLEPSADAEREAVRAAVEPLARRVLGVEISMDDLWRDYQAELRTKIPEEAFRKAVGRVVAAVGPARRQRKALQQIAEVLNTTESADACVKQVWKILLEVGAEPLQSTVLVKDVPTAEPAAGAPADASLDARENLRVAIEAMTTEEGEDPAEELFESAREADPGLTEEQARETVRETWEAAVARTGENESGCDSIFEAMVDLHLRATTATGLTEEPHEIADAAEKLLESLGEYVRQSMHANREWSEGIRAIEAALLSRKKRLLRASRGETGP